MLLQVLSIVHQFQMGENKHECGPTLHCLFLFQLFCLLFSSFGSYDFGSFISVFV